MQEFSYAICDDVVYISLMLQFYMTICSISSGRLEYSMFELKIVKGVSFSTGLNFPFYNDYFVN